MKTIAKVCIMFAVCFQSVAGIVEWTPENRQWENREIELWKQKFAESEKMAPFEKLEHLEPGLKNMGHRLGMNGHNPGIEVIYKKIQSTFFSTPGHAEYHRDKIEGLTIPYLQAREEWKRTGIDPS